MHSFRSFTVRQQLLTALAFDLLLLLGLGAFAWHGMGQMNQKARLVEQRSIPSLRNVDEIYHLETRYRGLQLEYLVHGNDADRDRIEKEFAEVERAIARALTAQRDLFADRPMAAGLATSFDELVRAWQRYEKANHQRFLPSARRSNTGTVQPALSRLNPLYLELLAKTQAFADDCETESMAALTSMTTTYHGTRRVIVVATVASLTVSAVIGFVLAQAAHRAHVEAEAASAAKSLFLATVSHELRTPLNAMLGYAQLLQLEAGVAGHTSIREDLDRLVGAGRHLTAVINNILDFSKIEQGKVDVLLEWVALDGLLREVVALLEPAAAERGNRLELAIEGSIGSISTDPSKLRQILFNLLSNAVKFTENGQIWVRARRLQASPEPGIELRVEDTGIGIAAEHLPLLFRPFEQADGSITRRYGGTGLGLVVSRQLAELLGGTLTVSSQPGQGSTFRVFLPADDRSGALPPHSLNGGPAPGPA